MQKKSTSWGVIVLWLIFFFPVGLFYIIKKVTEEKFSYAENGKALRTLGIVLICFGAVYLFLSIGDITMLTGFFMFGGLGVLSFVIGDKYIKKGEKYSRYISIVATSKDLIIDNIAAAYPTSFEQAVKDLQAMINDGYFINSYINFNRGELIMPSDTSNTAKQTVESSDSQPISVKCQNCGATNKIVPGAVNECEYCGSPL